MTHECDDWRDGECSTCERLDTYVHTFPCSAWLLRAGDTARIDDYGSGWFTVESVASTRSAVFLRTNVGPMRIDAKRRVLVTREVI